MIGCLPFTLWNDISNIILSIPCRLMGKYFSMFSALAVIYFIPRAYATFARILIIVAHNVRALPFHNIGSFSIFQNAIHFRDVRLFDAI